MDVQRADIRKGGHIIPAIIIVPPAPRGAAVISHGYGGCKEEQLGLAFRIAEAGLAACAIDLRGHGQHPLPLDAGVLTDVDAAVAHCRRFGRVVAIGHSLGGRLALISEADFAVGISPPLDPSYCVRTRELLQKLRSYRVRPDDPDTVFDFLRTLPAYREEGSERTMVIYGSRDVPEIVESGDALKALGRNAVRIEGAIHGDTYMLESTFAALDKQLDLWFPRH
ncbi:MAG: alpha/beta fold hydrolase [Methanomassiliicoccus sp.]|nr:alpha/beta fold hydrolase [Methanomassiliicoccus sp.]